MSLDPRVPGWAFNKNGESSLLISSFLLIMALFILILRPGFLSAIFLVIVFVLWCLLLYFFRDPDRVLDRSPVSFYSPGDGVVSDIEKVQQVDSLPGEYQRIGIFLSVLDVHVQRAPISGRVDFVTFIAGKNHPAYEPAASVENEQIAMGIDTAVGKIMVKQISGILARKCYNYAKPGERIDSGQRYGLIKFGSRVELYLPPDVNIICSVGDKVKGGITVLAGVENVRS